MAVRLPVLSLLMGVHVLLAPLAHAEPADKGQAADGAIPAGALVFKGAWSSTSDSAPVPESGTRSDEFYRNPYFNLNYALGKEWTHGVEGPPPSDGGYYVLAQLQPKNPASAHVMIAAQDLFFSASPADGALELIENYAKNLDSEYTVEQKPVRVRVAGREFVRFDYFSPLAGLHWHVLATEIRCHVVEFVFTGHESAQRFAQSLQALQFTRGETPVCIKNFATAENVLQREEPVFPMPRFNPVPVRLVVDAEGRVKHIHFLSAFPEQAKSISEALAAWRFKPYQSDGRAVEVETGMVFGRAARRTASTPH